MIYSFLFWSILFIVLMWISNLIILVGYEWSCTLRYYKYTSKYIYTSYIHFFKCTLCGFFDF